MLTPGDTRFQQARAYHARGDLAQAAQLCRAILETHPGHFDALNLAAIIAFQTRDPGLAIQLFDRAVSADPTQAMPYCNRGLAQQELKQWDAALASYERAIALNPDFALAHYNRGNLLKELRHFDAASASYARAAAVDRNFFHAWYNRGNVLNQMGQWDTALDCFTRALQIRPDNAEAHHNRGVALLQLGQFADALASFDAATQINPELAETFANRAVVLKELKQLDAALASSERAIALKPGHAEAYVNRSDVLMEMGRFDDALETVEQAVRLRPDLAEPHRNRGVILAALNRAPEAIVSYERAIAIAPASIEAHVNKAMAWLLAGNLEAGWAEYEWRLQGDVGRSRTARREFLRPRWSGNESLAGKSILLHGEQGLGDALQFCRYVPLVAARGARVILEAPKPLEALFASLDGVAQLRAPGEMLPETEYVCSLMSLPLVFKTTLATVPARVPYLKAPTGKVREWRERLGESGKLRVGLVWSGGFRPDQPEVWAVNHRRNIPLAQFARLDQDVEFVSLQKGQPAESELADLNAQQGRGPAIADYANRLHDFSDTAALVENLDLVISVDTSTAHLAGALAKPVWLLNRFDTCWRWLINREDSPWYPTMRIYRQPRPGDWESVMERVKTDLDDFVAEGLRATQLHA